MKIVIIGAGEFQNPLILKAKEMGLETHVFAWREDAVGDKTADYFYPISITEKEKILEKCKRIIPDGVVTIASDLAAITVQYVAERLGLPCNSLHCVEKSTDKYKMRMAFRKAGISVPDFALVSDILKLPDRFYHKLPLVVKPVDRSGSRAVRKVQTEEELKKAIEAAIEISFKKSAIIEEYIEGDEYSCETISYHGQHQILAFTKKYTTGAPNFIETAHVEPSDLSSKMIKRVSQNIISALNALSIQNGASHSEFRIDSQGNVKMIEVGARMAGDCIGSSLVPLSTGYDYLKMVIDIAIGNKPDFHKAYLAVGAAAVKFIFSEKDASLLTKIKNSNPELIDYVSPMLVNQDKTIVDSSTRYGFFVLHAENRGRLMRSLED